MFLAVCRRSNLVMLFLTGNIWHSERNNFCATFASWHYPFVHSQNDVCGLSLSYCHLRHVAVQLALAIVVVCQFFLLDLTWNRLSVRVSRKDHSSVLAYSYFTQLLLVLSNLAHPSVIICMLMTTNCSFLLCAPLNSPSTFYTGKLPQLIYSLSVDVCQYAVT